jgi:hypothetical protein
MEARMSETLTLGFTESTERLAAAVTPYGLGTKSYNSSPEKREVDRQRKAATEAYESAPRQEIKVLPLCSCPQRSHPHELSIHTQLKSESYIRVNKFRWPWSLVQSQRIEPSTERSAA